MRLVTFENPSRAWRIGAVTGNDDRIVDLNSACALHLKEHENEQAFERLADALVPSNMRALFEGGDTSLNAPRKALSYVLDPGIRPVGLHGGPPPYSSSELVLNPPAPP